MVNYYRALLRNLRLPESDGTLHLPVQILWGEKDLAPSVQGAHDSMRFLKTAHSPSTRRHSLAGTRQARRNQPQTHRPRTGRLTHAVGKVQAYNARTLILGEALCNAS